MNYETLLENQNHLVPPNTSTFAMYATKPGQSSNRKNKNGCGPFPPKVHNPKPNNPFNSSAPPKSSSPQNSTPFRPNRPPCQICGRNNHQALDCYHRMEFSFQGRHPPAQLAAMAAHTHIPQDDQPWYVDSGANNHIAAAIGDLSLA